MSGEQIQPRYADLSAQALIEKAAAGDPDAMVHLAGRHLFGSNGVEKDIHRAFDWYLEAAQVGHVAGSHNLGIWCETGFREFLDLPDPPYFPPDYQTALGWFMYAAEKGLPSSAGKVGEYYLDGKGVPQNYREAIKWLIKGAEFGDPLSLFLLGRVHRDGLGVPKDAIEAHKYFNIVSTHGGVLKYGGEFIKLEAIKNRDRLNGMLSADHLSEAQERAFNFKPIPYPKWLAD